MSKWEMVRLGDVCTDEILKLSSKDDFLIDYVDISSVDNQKKKIVSYQTFTTKDAPSRAKQMLEKDDIIVSTVRPNLNAVAINNIESENKVIASTGYCVLRCKEMVDFRYIFNYCKSRTFVDGLSKIAKGASYPAVSNSDVRDSILPLPPLDIQKHIADTLDKTQEIIDCNKRQLEELDNLNKATFYDMFGNPVTNEKGWSTVLLGEKVNVIGGYAFKSDGYIDNGIPVIKIGNINSGVFINDGISYWAEDSKLIKYVVHPNDIVISLTGTVGKDDYANVCVLPNEYPRYYLNQRNAKLEIMDSLNTRYLQYVFKDKDIKGKLTGISRGIRQANISNRDILELIIPLPPLDLQNKFAQIVTNIEEQKALVKQSIAESQNLFNSLMSKYFD